MQHPNAATERWTLSNSVGGTGITDTVCGTYQCSRLTDLSDQLVVSAILMGMKSDSVVDLSNQQKTCWLTS